MTPCPSHTKPNALPRPARPWLVLAFLLAGVTAACATGPAQVPAAQAPMTQAPTTQALQAIEQVIGDAPCESHTDCRTVGIGAKSCGGPDRYLAWSVRYTQQAELDKRVSVHRDAKRAENMRDGRMSNCAVTPVPSTSCVAGRCSLQPGPSSH